MKHSNSPKYSLGINSSAHCPRPEVSPAVIRRLPRYFRYLRERAIIVRYFPGESTGKFVRITIGTPEAMEELMAVTREFCGAKN